MQKTSWNPVRDRNKEAKSSRLLRYHTEILDAGMPMPLPIDIDICFKKHIVHCRKCAGLTKVTKSVTDVGEGNHATLYVSMGHKTILIYTVDEEEAAATNKASQGSGHHKTNRISKLLKRKALQQALYQEQAVFGKMKMDPAKRAQTQNAGEV
jgi:hypothetical protein